jgi:glycerol kinase
MRGLLHHCSYRGVNGLNAQSSLVGCLSRRFASVARVIAVDAGTTGVRALVLDESGEVVDVAYRELTQYFPRPAWVEHDPVEIWEAVSVTLDEVARRQRSAREPIAAIGITNQRETVVTWDRRTGAPLHRCIVWQDRRSAELCEELERAGHLPMVREKTGLVLDPYFSATKMAWLLRDGAIAPTPDTVMATVDSWVLWNLTGGASGGVLATEPSNASRTMLMDIRDLRWSEELCDLFGVKAGWLPEIQPSCGRFGSVAEGATSPESGLSGVPVSGIAGDQQAALFGQACFSAGMAKATYGTGTFVLLNVGERCPEPVEGLLTTVAWDLGRDRTDHAVSYALEGAVFATGSAIQWLRDGLGIISEAAEVGPLASQVSGTEGVYVVPAFTGLGSPWWDPYARGVVTGIARGTGRAHLARGVVESIAYQVRDVVDCMREAGADLAEVRVDGGASVMDLLLQLQADQIRVRVTRPRSAETTALGAATLAGLAEEVWASLEEVAALWEPTASHEPRASAVSADSAYSGWRDAVGRALGWGRESP